MSESAIIQAGRTQNEASDPLVSAFVSASAGSGKTKLLIDRLLRLMLPVWGVDPETGARVLLPGSDPSRIQCLTFTKAAAAEMSNRLQTRLGQWVSLADAALDAELRGLDVPATAQTRHAARSLFVRVLDLPGGMKIGTIHAFCQSLLRRFPLEASVNPHFTLLEETDATLALSVAIEQTLGEALVEPRLSASLDLLAGQVGLDEYLLRVRALSGRVERLGPLFRRWETQPGQVRALYAELLGAGSEDVAALEHQWVRPPDEPVLVEKLRSALAQGSDSMQAHVGAMLSWLAQTPDTRSADGWRARLLTDKGTPRTARAFVRAAADKLDPGIMQAITDEARRIIDLEAAIATRRLLDLNLALFALATPTLARYARDKAARGLVDYDDLIASTRDLLRDPGAAWVLYKLDGGIDHLLLDEVQDTSRAQWEIAGALTSEFFAGEGAHDENGRPRTVFAVGDFKQSIYAFQGADPEGFHHWRTRFAAMVRESGQFWRDPGLNVSFRSVPPVLELVDAVFAQDKAAHGLRAAGTQEVLPRHVSARAGEGGRVELWPLAPRGEKEETADPWQAAPWPATGGRAARSSAPQRLAEELARWIAAQIGKAPQPGQPPLRAGDVLILVPRRSPFLRALIRGLKGHGVEVATLVRVGLTDQLAVQDLMALCEVLLLPQDDLMLACVLTSPLGGLTDDSLMALAMERGEQPLWSVLRDRHAEQPEWRGAWAMLAALQRRIDFATPYQIIADALGRHGGRARLLRRLGAEAAEPMDDLLAAALRYEALHPPSMQGFLHWLKASDASVKREPEASADAVRIMTVHGAKGLQSRLVILPDTTSPPRHDARLLWAEKDGVTWPVWSPGKNLGCALTERLADAEKEAERAERNRLLYVALTRASDWLVVCGWESGRALSDSSWYALCRSGFTALSVSPEAFGGPWDGDAYRIEASVSAPSAPARRHEVASASPLPGMFGQAPDWQAIAPEQEAPLTRPLAPSRPDGVAFGSIPPARSPLVALAGPRETALRRGTLVHRLLQFLPDHPSSARRELAREWLSRPAHGLSAPDAARLSDQVMAIMEAPALRPLFAEGSRAEQAITGIVGGQVVVGQVDRLCVAERTVYIADYKTNQNPPRDGKAVPVTYRRQMAAYAAVMRQIYPDHAIRCALVWTEGPLVTPLPEDDLISEASEGA
mgnify:CR=1 FL=1